MIVVVK